MMPPVPASPLPSLEVAKLRAEVLQPLLERFAGKEELVELIALVLCASENLLIVGPPGTAKSQVVSEFASRIAGRYFEYLLTRFTEPSEIFGPVDIRELREGRLVTRTEGMLPEAEIVFLDEVFNASSAILNSLLGIINDGLFRRGSQVEKTPLISILGATNRIPDEPSLRALEDRFTVRVECASLEDDQLANLLERGWQIEQGRLRGAVAGPPSSFTTADLRSIHAAVAAADLAGIRGLLTNLLSRVRAAGIFVSDRRAVKLQRLVAAAALLCGRSRALPADLWPARYIWERVDDREILEEVVEEAAASPADIPDLEGAAGPDLHPLSAPARQPGDLLERARRMEAEMERLEPSVPPHRTDALYNQLQDLDAERRWCRPRNAREEDELRELGQRLEAMAEVLARREGAR